MKRSPRYRSPSEVSRSLHTRLNAYALAASAAGVSVLAMPQSGEAKVVYTPAHQVIAANGVYNLDLTGDGTVNFLIQQWQSGYPSNNSLLCDAAVGNAIVGHKSFASALSAGASIGPGRNFISGGNNGEQMLNVTHFTTGGTSYVHGFWANIRNQYLGFKFQVAGEIHYGWARVSVQRNANVFTAVLTGYAYETTPNTAITAGETSGADSSSSNSAEAQPARSLGELALGAAPAPERRLP